MRTSVLIVAVSLLAGCTTQAPVPPTQPAQASNRPSQGAVASLAPATAFSPPSLPTPTPTPLPSVSVLPGASITWTEVMSTDDGRSLIEEDDTIMSAILFGGGYVLAGNANNAGRAVVWQSSDGTSWQRIEDGPSFADSTMRMLVAIPGGVLAIGAATASDGLCSGGEGTTCNPVSPIRLWTSSDGRPWQRLPDVATAAFGRAQLTEAASGPDVLVLFGWHVPVAALAPTQPMVWTSADGRTWRVRKQFGRTFPDGVVEGLIASANGFAAVGRNTGLESPHMPGTAWFSGDGRTWTAASVPASTDEETRVYAGSSGLLASGLTDGPTVFWSSPDGRSWSAADASAFPFTSNDRSPVLVSDGTRIMAVGANRSGASGAWVSSDGLDWQSIASIGTVPPIPATDGGTIGALGPRGVVLATTINAATVSISVWVGS